MFRWETYVKTDPKHPHVPRWKQGLRIFGRDITHHIRIFFQLYTSFLEPPVTVLDYGSKGQMVWAGLRSDPRRDKSCCRLGWVIEQELLLYFWHKQRWDRNACIQYARLHRGHRHHPWVIDTLFTWADAGDERRVLQLLGLRLLQGHKPQQAIEETLWHLFVREAVDELRAKGMSIRQATIALAGNAPRCWPISQRLLAMAESWTLAFGHDILRAVGQKDLERLCYPYVSEQMWRAFCTAHHGYHSHLEDTHSLPSFPRALSCWHHLFWRCRHLYQLPVIRPPEWFDLPTHL